MPKHVPPSIDSKSFSCPTCGAHTAQSWFDVFAEPCGRDTPYVVTPRVLANVKKDIEKAPREQRELMSEWLPEMERLVLGGPALTARGGGKSKLVDYDLDNIHVSRCYTCGAIALWRHDTILYPPHQYEVEPNPDITPEIQADFNEARTVLDLSPRSAAALLRLCVQKLCVQLGQPGRNLNDDIGALVAAGLDPRVQKALDLVRVIGNNAVHPGAIDFKDDRETAAKLFTLVNSIAEDMISHPKALDALYDEKIPQSQKDQIAKRDGGKG